MQNKEQDIANEFMYMLANKKSKVVNAIQNAGVDIDDNISPSKIITLMRKYVYQYSNENDEIAKKVIFNVSEAIASENSMFSNAVNDGKKWYQKISVDNVLKVGNSLVSAFNNRRIPNKPSPTKPPQIPYRPNPNPSPNPNPNYENSQNSSSSISTGKIIGFSVLGLALISVGVLIYKNS